MMIHNKDFLIVYLSFLLTWLSLQIFNKWFFQNSKLENNDFLTHVRYVVCISNLLFLVLRNIQCIKCIKGNVFLVGLHCSRRLSLVFICNWMIFVSDCLTFSSAYLTLVVEDKFSVYLTLFMDQFLRNIAPLIIGNWFKVSKDLNKIIPRFLHQSCDFIKLSVSFLLR